MDCELESRFERPYPLPVDNGRDLFQEPVHGGTVPCRGWLGVPGRISSGVAVLFWRQDGDHRGRPANGWEVDPHTGMPLQG